MSSVLDLGLWSLLQTPLLLKTKGPYASVRGETTELSGPTKSVPSQTKFSHLLPVLATNFVALLDLFFPVLQWTHRA